MEIEVTGLDWESNLAASKRRLFQHLKRELGDERILQAMSRVPRELFAPPSSRHLAYRDIPLPLGYNQTISQPYMVAMMTAALSLKASDRVLEIGTGSGYQAAVLAEICSTVYTVERIPQLYAAARQRLDSLGYQGRVFSRMAGGTLGIPKEAPFSAIIVTAGAPTLPINLLDQLACGGRLVIPIGPRDQQTLFRVTRKGKRFITQTLGTCRFVPLLGEEAWKL